MAQKRSDGTIAMTDRGAAIVIDEAPYPVIVTTWFGEATVPLVDEFHGGWLWPRMAKARATGERLVLLNDTFASERPTPVMRKYLAEKAQQQPKEDREAMVGSVVVIESALVRSALTALGWFVPSLAESEFVGTLEEATKRCLVIVERHGLRTPSDLRSYRRPARP